jgi:hypothetical protein
VSLILDFGFWILDFGLRNHPSLEDSATPPSGGRELEEFGFRIWTAQRAAEFSRGQSEATPTV